jgi:hypothetical protein
MVIPKQIAGGMAMAWFGQSKPEDRIIIARIEGAHYKAVSLAAVLFLLVGALAMFIAVLTETSAVRLAAWAAIWTGWNILFGIAALSGGGSVRYIVYRENQPT